MSGPTDTIAPDGKLWVCFACGKTAKDKFGGALAMEGWDASCMINSGLVDIDKLVFNETENRVVMIKGDKV